MKRLFSFRVWIAALAIAVVLTGALVIYILVTAPPGLPPVSAVLTLIPASTSTPRDLPPTFTPLPPPLEASPTPLPGSFAVGAFVQITETGLRLREAPGLNAKILFTGEASEVFRITDGPQEADGHTWWHLTAPYDATRAGWAVQDYLTVIPPP
jgi:hypothetical protein